MEDVSKSQGGLKSVVVTLGKALATGLVSVAAFVFFALALTWSNAAGAAFGFGLGLLFFGRTIIQLLEVFVLFPDIAARPRSQRRDLVLALAVVTVLVGPAVALLLPLGVAHAVHAHTSSAPAGPWFDPWAHAAYGVFGLPNQFDAPDAAPLALVQAAFMWIYTSILVAVFAGVVGSSLYQRSRAARPEQRPTAALSVRVETSRWPWRGPRVHVESVPVSDPAAPSERAPSSGPDFVAR